MSSVNRVTKAITRDWRRRPALALVVTLTLTAGLAVALVVAEIVRVVVLTPLPYRDPAGLAVLHSALPGQQQAFSLLSGPDLVAIRDQASTLAASGGMWSRPGVLGTANSQTEIEVGWVTAGFLEAFGVTPALGRLPTREETLAPGSVIVLSDRLWRERFAADPAVIGRRIIFDDEPVTVVGVMPASFRLLFPAEQAVPAHLDGWLPWGPGLDALSRSFRVFTGIARLTAGSNWPAARAELDRIAAHIAVSDVAYGRSGFELRAVPLEAALMTPVRPVMTMLVGVAILVLIVSGANVANLLLAQARTNERDLRVQIALGAGSSHLWRDGLVRVAALVSPAGVLALAIAAGVVRYLAASGAIWLPRLGDASLDYPLAFAALGLVAATALGLGVVVVGAATRAARRGTLHAATRGASGSALARRGLVIAQVALSVVVAVAAGLLVRTFLALQRVDLGFDPAGVVSMRLSLPDVRYPYRTGGPQIAEFYRRLDEQIAALPSVIAAGATLNPPLSELAMRPRAYAYRGADGDVPWGTLAADYRTVTPGWFAAVGARLQAGRLLDDRDRWDRPIAVVVDARLAARAWPGREAVGQRIQVEVFREARFTPTWGDVVGVVAPIRLGDLVSDAREQVYLSHHQAPQRTMYPAVKVAGDPMAIVPAIQEIVGRLQPGLPIFEVRTAASYLDRATAATRFALVTLVVAASVAIVLAVSGVYAAIAFMVGERRREIGIRVSVGATPAAIRGLVLRQGIVLVASGLAIGIAGAAGATRVVERLLFGVAPADPLTAMLVAALIASAGLAATWWPAVRAARLDPRQAIG